jgi:hypothetical protein
MHRVVIALLLLLLLCGCTRNLELVLCPAEVSSRMEQTAELGHRRELLFPLQYDVVFVTMVNDKPVPMPLLAAQQPPTSPRPRTITFDQPAHISDYFIMERPLQAVGIAIKPYEEDAYRVQWFTPDAFEAAAARGFVELKPLDQLPILKN